MVGEKYNTGFLQFGIGENQPGGRNLALALQEEAMKGQRECNRDNLYTPNRFETQALNFIDDYNKYINGRAAGTWTNTAQFRHALYNLT